MSNRDKGTPDWVINTVIMTILALWVLNFVAQAFLTWYEPIQGADALMLIVAGFLFAGNRLNKKDDKDGEDQ